MKFTAKSPTRKIFERITKTVAKKARLLRVTTNGYPTLVFTAFIGTLVIFKRKDREFHCVLRQFSNVFYPTQLDNYEYKSFMNFSERFQEDEIYRKIGCTLS
uniref:Uncharacterized protein n=1 Tax=Romanomermis culicivorax TaxID=13658 RepID=A0A915J3E9_ROMCU